MKEELAQVSQTDSLGGCLRFPPCQDQDVLFHLQL